RLAALEPVLGDYLQEASSRLSARLGTAGPAEQRDLLLALNDLRAEAGTAVLSLLSQPDFPHVPLAIEVLTWSKDTRVGSWLREWTMQKVSLLRRAQKRRRSLPPRRPSLPADIPYKEVLYALRGPPSGQTESFLLMAARDWAPTYRAAAVASLGWWEPLSRAEVLLTLADARRDPNPEVRQNARAALARLGERQ